MTLTDDLCDGLDVGYAEQALRGALRAERGGTLDEHPFVVGVEMIPRPCVDGDSSAKMRPGAQRVNAHAQPCNSRSWEATNTAFPFCSLSKRSNTLSFAESPFLCSLFKSKPSCTMMMTNNSSVTRSPPRTLPHADYHLVRPSQYAVDDIDVDKAHCGFLLRPGRTAAQLVFDAQPTIADIEHARFLGHRNRFEDVDFIMRIR